MKTIGLLGGMSWESTAVYYRQLNEAVRDRLGGLHSARVLMHSVDFAEIVQLQSAGQWDLAADLLAKAAAGLVQAGADCVLICTNTMHLVADEVAARVSVPLINIIDETGHALAAVGKSRPLLLATRYTMEHGFYQSRIQAACGIEVLAPNEADRHTVHGIIFDELCRGIVRPESHASMLAVIDRGIAAGADSVILGCTEICLLLNPDTLAVPGFDSTAIHAQSAVNFSLRSLVRAAA